GADGTAGTAGAAVAGTEGAAGAGEPGTEGAGGAGEPGGSELLLSQERFGFVARTQDRPLWQVPVVARSLSLREDADGPAAGGGCGSEVRFVLTEASGRAPAPAPAPAPATGAVTANAHGDGFYRTRYSAEMLGRLTANLASLDVIERFGLVSDAWAFAIGGHAPLTYFTELISLYAGERDPNVWRAITYPLMLIRSVTRHLLATSNPGVPAAVATMARGLMRPVLDEVGLDGGRNDTEPLKKLRGLLVTSLGTLGEDSEVISEAHRLHREHLSGATQLAPEIAAAVVTVVAKTGGEQDFDGFLERFRHPANPQEQLRYLAGLAGFEEAAVIDRAIGLVFTEVKMQDRFILLHHLLANPAAGRQAWQFIEQSWDDICSQMPPNLVPRALMGIVHLCEPALASAATEFLASHPLASNQLLVDQSLERLAANVAFFARNGGKLGPSFAGPASRH
ncbi:MAG: ERAP1-like C-terminal domain-containing protein, partial [Acidimicrobiales bacterium]